MKKHDNHFENHEDAGDDASEYADLEDIDFNGLHKALLQLKCFGGDPFLSSQIFGLGYVDQFITRLEYQVLRDKFYEEKVCLEDSVLLSAQSQMWIFAIYEILRTWRQRVKKMLRLASDSKLESELAKLEKPTKFSHHGRQIRASQYRQALEDKTIITTIKADIRRTSIPFLNIEFIRMLLAKHEIPKQIDSIAYTPGFGLINRWCGSLDYDMDVGNGSIGFINRRDIADMLRSIWESPEPPSDEEIQEVKAVLSFKDL